MRTIAIVVWALFGWPIAVVHAARARRRLRGYGEGERGPLGLERVA